MSPVIDFTQIQSLEPIEAGAYHAEIVAATDGQSKSGNPKIDVRWRITEGEYEGRQVFDSLSFHPQALWRTKASLQALGFDEDFAGEITGEDLVNRSAVIVVTVEEGNGIDPATGEPYPARNRVTKVRSAMDLGDFIGA